MPATSPRASRWTAAARGSSPLWPRRSPICRRAASPAPSSSATGRSTTCPTDLDSLGFRAPVHMLLSGLPDEADRRLVMAAAPSFGIVDKDVAFKLRVEDGAAAPGTLARIDIMKDGKPLPPVQVAIGEDVPFNFDIDHGGQNIFEFSVEPGTKELSLANNSAIALVNGVRDRLKVLLISGEPHAGERAWRSLLKSDPSVDLVHFTILRPPEKQDGTPINELSLIAFPVRELFELQAQGFRPRHLRPLPARRRAAAGLFRQHRQLRRAGRRAAGFGGPRLLHHLQPLSLAARPRAARRAHGRCAGAGLPARADAAGPAPSRHLRPAGQRAAAAGSRPGAAGSARSMPSPARACLS